MPDPTPMPRSLTEPVPRGRSRFPDAAEPSIIVDGQWLMHTYVRFVRRHRVLLIGLPLLCAVVTAATLLSRPRSYASQLTVSVSRGTDDGLTIVASFRPYLENHRIIEEVIKEFKLDEAPMYMTRSVFLHDHYSVEPVRNTNLVTIRLRLHDPKLVANVLNRIGERALALLDQTAVELGNQMQRGLKRERDEAATRVEQASVALQNFKTANQIELLRKDVDSALELRGALLSLSVRIAEHRSRLLQAEADLKTHESIQRFARTLEEDQLLVEAARQRQQGGGSMASMTLRSEYANPVHEQLLKAIASTRIDLASLEEQRRQLIGSKGLGADKLPLLTKLYAAERTLVELDRRQTVVTAAYDEIATKYELAHSRSFDRSSQLVIIDPALPADRPMPRGLAAKTTMGGAAGLALALLVILFQRPGVVHVERTEVV
jgi:uncharacterized protein involved in exopolysaccharide biosynthesis